MPRAGEGSSTPACSLLTGSSQRSRGSQPPRLRRVSSKGAGSSPSPRCYARDIQDLLSSPPLQLQWQHARHLFDEMSVPNHHQHLCPIYSRAVNGGEPKQSMMLTQPSKF